MSTAPTQNSVYESEQKAEAQKGRMGIVGWVILLLVALCFDIAQWFLTFLVITAPLTIVVSVVAWLTFFIWFKMKGVSFGMTFAGGQTSFFKNPLMVILTAFGIEIVPIVNILPTWFGATATLLITKAI